MFQGISSPYVKHFEYNQSLKRDKQTLPTSKHHYFDSKEKEIVDSLICEHISQRRRYCQPIKCHSNGNNYLNNIRQFNPNSHNSFNIAAQIQSSW